MIIKIQSNKRERRLEEKLEVIHSGGNNMCKNLRNIRIMNICRLKCIVIWYCQNMVVRKSGVWHVARLDREAEAR